MESRRHAGHFELLRRIGRGGMGEVWLARDTRLGRLVAIKVLPPELVTDERRRALFEREARAAAALQHRNIATVHQLEEAEIDGERQLLLVLELVEGTNPLHRQEAWSEPELVRFGLQVARALEAAHRQGIIHRDLKPANLMLTGEGDVKVLDFGIAHLVGSDDSRAPTVDLAPTVSTADRAPIVGTLGFMAPEQARGDRVDHRSDLFSLGVILFRLATGVMPYGAASWGEYLQELRAPPERVQSVLDLSPGLQALILRLLAVDPDDRPATAAEVAEELGALLETGAGGSSGSLEVDARATARRRGARGPLWIGAALVGVILVAAPLWLWLGPAEASPIRLAVLDFENLTGEPERSYFCRGLSSVLSSELTSLEELAVLGRIHAAGLGADAASLEDLVDRYRVDRVIEGSVQRDDDELVVTVSLVEPRDGRTRWSGSVRGPLEDPLAVQRRLAEMVADRFAGELSESSRRRLSRATARSPRAFELVLRGRELLATGGSASSAAAAFRLAIEEDETISLAWSGLAAALSAVSLEQAEPALLAETEQAARRALSLDPESIEARVALSRVLRLQGRNDEAVALLESESAPRGGGGDPGLQGELSSELILSYAADGRAAAAAERLRRVLQDRPASAVHLELALGYAAVGDRESAETAFLEALEAAPGDWRAITEYGAFLNAGARFSEARAQFERAAELAPPGEDLPLANLAGTYLYEGDVASALELFELVESPITGAELASNYGTALFFAGRIEEAVPLYELATRLEPRNPAYRGNLGDALDALGRDPAARSAYRSAIALLTAEIAALPELSSLRVRRILFQAKLGECDEVALEGVRLLARADSPLSETEALAKAFGVCGLEGPALAAIETLLAGGYRREMLEQQPELSAVMRLRRSSPRADASPRHRE